MESNKLWLIVQILLVAAWMFLIFNFSNENSKTSQGTSDKLLFKVVEIVKGRKLSDADKTRIRKKYSFYIRKGAHFFLYSVLGMTIYIFLCYILKSPYKIVLLSIIISILYAVSDEFHQSFIPGRSAAWFDVVVDSCGAGVGISCILFLRSIVAFFRWKFKKRPTN